MKLVEIEFWKGMDMQNKYIDCEMCPDCLDECSDELWMVYYEQYYEAVKVINEENKRSNNVLLLPMVLLLAQYMEIWTKAITVNYGAGKYGKIEADVIYGHKPEELMQKMVDIISEEEWAQNQDKIYQIDNIYSWFNDMTENGVPLSIAMRYPKTKENHSSLCSCILSCVSGECDRFDAEQCYFGVKKILKLTYEVYDNIYNFRMSM